MKINDYSLKNDINCSQCVGTDLMNLAFQQQKSPADAAQNYLNFNNVHKV